MTLKNFINELERISEKHGDDIKIVMADNLPVVSPVFCKKNYFNEKVVVITDEE